MVRVLMKKGDRVRMSDSLKARLRGKCGEAGRHLGPFDPDDVHDCWGCSSAHVEEFGDCVGIVQGLMDYNNCEPTDAAYDPSKTGPEVDVRWQPSNLRYAYHPSDLELIGSDRRITVRAIGEANHPFAGAGQLTPGRGRRAGCGCPRASWR